MKTLILVRHAKSDQKGDPAIKDFDRPLNHRGESDAPAMASRLADSGIKVDALVSSPARRALATAEAFSRKLNLPVQTDMRIYEAGVAELQTVVRELDDRLNRVALFGHNPGLSDFLCYLTEENYADLPTAGIAVVGLPVKSWKYVFEGKGALKSSLCPNRDELGMKIFSPPLNRAGRFRLWRIEHGRTILLTVVFVLSVLLILGIVALVMHLGTNPSAMPQQGSPSR